MELSSCSSPHMYWCVCVCVMMIAVNCVDVDKVTGEFHLAEILYLSLNFDVNLCILPEIKLLFDIVLHL